MPDLVVLLHTKLGTQYTDHQVMLIRTNTELAGFQFLLNHPDTCNTFVIDIYNNFRQLLMLQSLEFQRLLLSILIAIPI